MHIQMTAGELLDKEVWEEFCAMFDINVWAINEGLMDVSEKFNLSVFQAKTLGIIGGLEYEELYPASER